MKHEYRRAVSPVIAVILIIALTVAAIAIIWSTSDSLIDINKDELILDTSGVADTNGDDRGDYIQLYLRNIGTKDSIIESVELSSDGTVMPSWVLKANSYTIAQGEIGVVELQTITIIEQIIASNDVIITLKSPSTGSIAIVKDLIIPYQLSALPIIYAGNNFTNIDINAQGWTSYKYAGHGGGPGINVDQGDVVFATNDDLLFYLKNDNYLVQSGLITADFMYGDNDAIGIAFRIVDELNYYWVGYTNDHNSPANRAGETEASFDGPWFNSAGTFEIHRLVNGVDTLLASAVPKTFSVASGRARNPTGPIGLKISINFNDFAFEARSGVTGNYEELFTVSDVAFPDAGYFGVFSLACQDTRLADFSVVA